MERQKYGSAWRNKISTASALVSALLLVASPTFAQTALGSCTSAPITITSPGSYILKHNLSPSSSGSDCIDVSVSNVSIDLNGFGMRAAKSGVMVGINATVGGEQTNISVSNGYVIGMTGAGVLLGAGSVEGVLADTNGADGIHCTENCVISGDTANSNTDSGIQVDGSHSLIENNMANLNGVGINAGGQYNLIKGNTASGNTTNGINCGSGCEVSGNVADDNTDVGLSLTASTSGYTENVLTGNGTQVSGGTSMGAGNTNLCNGSAC